MPRGSQRIEHVELIAGRKLQPLVMLLIYEISHNLRRRRHTVYEWNWMLGQAWSAIEKGKVFPAICCVELISRELLPDFYSSCLAFLNAPKHAQKQFLAILWCEIMTLSRFEFTPGNTCASPSTFSASVAVLAGTLLSSLHIRPRGQPTMLLKKVAKALSLENASRPATSDWLSPAASISIALIRRHC
ncbi:Uncharacterised protein [Serratia rubidaea]|uniref:Uncharacterized protein n=1 Tax=Serratia rubidaea TaxID=61652 RepID=A0A3S4JUU5_SERRU|nr:Uncharacterised protein [Serratia rubidaea]